MDLIKEKWNISDLEELNEYLFNLRNIDKIEWTKKIINSNYDVLAIKSPVLKEIANNISKGNYLSLLDILEFKYYEMTIIYVGLLNKIKDIDKFIFYLEKLFKYIDNWSTVDVIDFSIVKKDKKLFFDKAKEYIKNKEEFIKRVGIRILFKYIEDEYLDEIINIINSIDSKDYYVSMCIAWLLTEMMIKKRDYIIDNLNKIKVDDFTFKKFVSKCIDSYRISDIDKDYLRRKRNER